MMTSARIVLPIVLVGTALTAQSPARTHALATSREFQGPSAGPAIAHLQTASPPPTPADLSSDRRVRWLRREAIRVRTVDPADPDYRDLQPLKKAIGDARIVMLGEISHGDGTTMLAKSRLVKFLHEQMHFDVLVFESPLYGVSKAWESIQQGQEPLAAVRPAIFGVWSRSVQARDLFEYIGRAAKSPRPLALAGFDVQFMSPTRDNLLKELDALVARLGITSDVTTPGSEARTLAVNLFADRYGEKGLPAPDAAARKAFYDGLEVLRDRLTAATTASNEAQTSFWRQVIFSQLESGAALVWWAREHGYDNSDWATIFDLRDRRCADNLLWLADHQYRGKKIIVWGASMHLVRQVPTIEATIDPKDPQHGYTGIVTLGEEVWRRIGLEAFTIGFTCYEGRNGAGNPKDTDRSWLSAIKKDQDPSIELEELLNAARFDYAIVSFRKPAAHGEWLKEPIVSRPLGNQGMRAVWPNIMDAMFFIRVMEPNWVTRPAEDNRRH